MSRATNAFPMVIAFHCPSGWWGELVWVHVRVLPQVSRALLLHRFQLLTSFLACASARACVYGEPVKVWAHVRGVNLPLWSGSRGATHAPAHCHILVTASFRTAPTHPERPGVHPS